MEDEVHQASFLEYFLALISLSLSLSKVKGLNLKRAYGFEIGKAAVIVKLADEANNVNNNYFKANSTLTLERASFPFKQVHFAPVAQKHKHNSNRIL